MKNIKNTIFYFAITGGFISLMYWIVNKGKELEIGNKIMNITQANDSWGDFIQSMTINLHHPLAILLAQIITIIMAARFFGWLFRKIGQPSVVGEIIAGIVLGPSLLGMYFPDISAGLFPTESLGNLQFLSQIGLILFMFVIGMELDLKMIKNRAQDAVVISHASIVIPFALGIGLSYFVYNKFAPEGTQFLAFSLFMGISMSITAFPVLARIVQERGIHKTKLGNIIITCAAADDITAWSLLAAVIAIVKAGSFESSLYVIGLAVLYVLVMLFLVKPFLSRIGDIYGNRNELDKPIVAIFFLTLIISSFATEVIGIHALFGAFLTGAIMPDITKFRNVFIEKVEDVSVILLLPLFFVFTGLRTQIGLIDDPFLWKVTALIILVAVSGKFFGSALAAKFIGQSWKDSLIIGALMNTRGLMELVVLNIGLDLGVLTPQVFTMMVIMALVTTFMTGPALDLIAWIFKRKQSPTDSITEKFKILISFGNKEKGKSLLKLANALVGKEAETSEVTAMHLILADEMHGYDTGEYERYERKNFAPIIDQAKQLNQKMDTVFKATFDIENEISQAANHGGYNLLLVGLGKSIFEGTFLGKLIGFTTRIINPERLMDKFTGKEGLFENSPFDDRTREIITKTKIPIGILIDKGLFNVEKIGNILFPVLSSDDLLLKEYVLKLVENNKAEISVLNKIKNPETRTVLIQNAIAEIDSNLSKHFSVIEEEQLQSDLLQNQDLMIVSLESWKKLVDSQKEWLKDVPSILIVKQ